MECQYCCCCCCCTRIRSGRHKYRVRITAICFETGERSTAWQQLHIDLEGINYQNTAEYSATGLSLLGGESSNALAHNFHVHTVHLDNYQSFSHQLMYNWIVLKTILKFALTL